MAMLVDPQAFGLNADELAEALKPENIVARRFLDPPVHKMSYYRGRFGDISLPVTEFVAGNAVALPLYSDMTSREVEIITNAVRDLQANSAAVRAHLSAQSAHA